ncbi:hypothetical protein K435DRAFT_808299 [Dendrothele bispora CBS 962.96]|uniref:Uncharacterized protein n=1 Tax=Dendrothele bispora (strain CBS 962.96) TaxID=1314807 RepID=A0A4S8L369_DENBC|nr:hypothetical protein K435DRAFT_808299 [Dendrothele bispora CBS 962.96]
MSESTYGEPRYIKGHLVVEVSSFTVKGLSMKIIIQLMRSAINEEVLGKEAMSKLNKELRASVSKAGLQGLVYESVDSTFTVEVEALKVQADEYLLELQELWQYHLKDSNRSKRAKVVNYAEEEKSEIADWVENALGEVIIDRREASSSKRMLRGSITTSENT